MKKPINVDPAKLRCDICNGQYQRTGKTTIQIIWKCPCGKSEYHQRKR